MSALCLKQKLVMGEKWVKTLQNTFRGGGEGHQQKC